MKYIVIGVQDYCNGGIRYPGYPGEGLARNLSSLRQLSCSCLRGGVGGFISSACRLYVGMMIRLRPELSRNPFLFSAEKRVFCTPKHTNRPGGGALTERCIQ